MVNPISTHAPRTGSDKAWDYTHDERRISTHAPRTGSDVWRLLPRLLPLHFTPRSPHGERLLGPKAAGQFGRFQPTLPARGATGVNIFQVFEPGISTHAPRTGSDKRMRLPALTAGNFNPRSPHGERPTTRRNNQWLRKYFNPRSPHGERHNADGSTSFDGLFQPTLPARGATTASLPHPPT